MLEQHRNPKLRFDQQVENSENYVLPFIEQSLNITSDIKVMEVGCGEGGVLVPFLQRGCNCLGVDLAEERLELGRSYLPEYISKGQLDFLNQDIYELAFENKYKHQFDLIILKDVIEHIPKQEKFIPQLKKFLKPGGQIFFGFPPWHMPFGGHQQLLKSKLASKLPYYHVLPMPLYLGIQKLCGESKEMRDWMKMTKESGITVERFEKIVKQCGSNILSKQWFLFNPIYIYKFGVKPRKQNWLFGAIPYLRNYLTTCAYYTISD